MREGDSVYQQIVQCVRSIITALIANEANAIINTSSVARSAYQELTLPESSIPLPIEWTSVEQFKQIARRELRGKFGHESDENDVYQDDMFSGHLQRFYPVRVQGEEDPFYKRRELLTEQEFDQNLASLKKQADARLVHYDALLAYKLSRQTQAAD